MTGALPGSDEEFVDLFRATARGSLDVETRRALEAMDELSQAQNDFEFYAGWAVIVCHIKCEPAQIG